MRIYGALLIVVLLSAAFIFFLQGKSATESMQGVNMVAEALQESGVEGRVVDRDAAKRIITELRLLLDNPEYIRDNLAGLREITAIAAGWAKAAATPSSELHLAVSIRAAADELRAYGLSPSQLHLDRARRELDEADKALLGEAGASGPADAIRDRLDNLDRAHREKYQEIEELGN